MSENETMTVGQQPTLKLGGFEGPLDLLLHLIREAKMDIYDIKIATITSQYMDYLHQMKAHRLEIAGEYFVMASTLMRIKSQLLLPQAPPLDDEEPAEEPVDPRQELVDQLIEYQRYKKAADHLKDKESYRQQEYTRPAMRVPRDLVVNRWPRESVLTSSRRPLARFSSGTVSHNPPWKLWRPRRSVLPSRCRQSLRG